MEVEKFNFDTRREEWPQIEKLMSMFNDPIITKLKKSVATYRNGPFITLYKDNEPVISASVGFGLYAPTLRFDALHILLDYLQAQNQAVEWDAVSFAHGEAPMPRNSRTSLLDPATSDIARYARIGLKASFKEISAMPPTSKNAQIFNAFLANTATVEIVPVEPKRMSNNDLQDLLLATVAKAIKVTPQPGS